MIGLSDPPLPNLPGLPRFEVRLVPPALAEWRSGNCGVPGFHHFETGRAGPHVLVTALMHGNEIAGGSGGYGLQGVVRGIPARARLAAAGAIVLDALLRARLRPLRGRLTLGFLNLAAFARFEPLQPTASRFVDEDMNRLWDAAILDGTRQSVELSRAREIRPIVDSADILLDLHSMLWPSEPLILSGSTAKGRRLARAIGTPPMAVADRGHSSGPRLIDYAGFADEADARIACLVEAGPHWEPGTVATARAAVMALLRQTGLIADPEPAAPHDQCLLVMPSLRPSRGHTAVRLARFLDD